MNRALQIEELSRTHSYAVFSSFVRSAEVRNWLSQELSIPESDIVESIAALDRLQMKVHPEKLEDVERHAKGKLRLIAGYVLKKLEKCYPGHFAKRLFNECMGENFSLADGDDDLQFSSFHIPERWKLNLPRPPDKSTIGVMSPTRIDSYRVCPFTFYLRDKNVLGTRADFDSPNLTTSDYGNVAHRVLQAWGSSEFNKSDDEREIAQVISKYVDEDFHAIFGEMLPESVRIQRESLRCRLGYFATRQAKWRRDGWVVKSAEQKLSAQYAGTLFEGKCDRIDYNESTGQWCIIDYKTWAAAPKSAIKHNESLPLQLPIYCAMLALQSEGEFGSATIENTQSCYALIGETLESTFFSTPAIDCSCAKICEETTRKLLSQIEAGIFWPPSENAVWRRDFGRWIGDDPAAAISQSWISDQMRRIALLKA